MCSLVLQFQFWVTPHFLNKRSLCIICCECQAWPVLLRKELFRKLKKYILGTSGAEAESCQGIAIFGWAGCKTLPLNGSLSAGNAIRKEHLADWWIYWVTCLVSFAVCFTCLNVSIKNYMQQIFTVELSSSIQASGFLFSITYHKM